MKEFFVKKNVTILALFQSIISPNKISSQSVKKAFKEIGLEFNYSLIEDLKSKIIADKLLSVDTMGNLVLNSLVVLFTDHLLIRRIEYSRDVNKVFDVSFNEIFVKSIPTGQYITLRQYKTSITYMYSNLPKVTQSDPLLFSRYKKHKESKALIIKKSDSIKFLISRERVIEQISTEMRQMTSSTSLTDNEKEFVLIYNRSLALLKELVKDDVSLFTSKEAIVLVD